MTYYIYEVTGIKIGATKQWDQRRNYNFNSYQIEPIIVETMEGPDTEDMWKVVGDREWELADLNGYDKGTHYRVMRIRGANGLVVAQRLGGLVTGRMNVESGHLNRIKTKESLSKGGKAGGKTQRSITFEIAEQIRSEYKNSGNHNAFNIKGPTQQQLANKYNTTRKVVRDITNMKTYLTA